jgi:hypothetical protein
MHVGGPNAGANQKIFGKYDDGEAVNNSLYVYVLVSWLEIANSVLFNPSTKDEAKTLIDKMLKFEPILTATISNRIFSITILLSECLQIKLVA